ncbi:hypothetical protein FOL47_007521 [Perkinsus chesapeaki]|uniref:Uncharacterized protein n=1 Tax=Perkinsus chesapeaki TaxID=330153 RepID=A0A7J6LKX1_PERCH|nr:hypothetical protein FOL47_007521 [Perkinsus chesapeaki]
MIQKENNIVDNNTIVIRDSGDNSTNPYTTAISVEVDARKLAEIAAARVRRWRSESCRRERIRKEWIQKQEDKVKERKLNEGERIKQEKREMVIRARQHRREIKEQLVNGSRIRGAAAAAVSLPPANTIRKHATIKERPKWIGLYDGGGMRQPGVVSYGKRVVKSKEEQIERSIEARKRAVNWMKEAEARRRRIAQEQLKRELQIQRLLEEDKAKKRQLLDKSIAERNRARREAFESRQRSRSGSTSLGYRSRGSVSLGRPSKKKIPLPRYKSIERDAAIRKDNEERERKRILMERKIQRGLVPIDHEEIRRHMELVDSIASEATERAKHRTRMRIGEQEGRIDGHNTTTTRRSMAAPIPEGSDAGGYDRGDSSSIRLMRQKSYGAAIQRLASSPPPPQRRGLPKHRIIPPPFKPSGMNPSPLQRRRPLKAYNGGAALEIIELNRKRAISRVREYRVKDSTSPLLLQQQEGEDALLPAIQEDPIIERRLAAIKDANEYINSGVHRRRELAIKKVIRQDKRNNIENRQYNSNNNDNTLPRICNKHEHDITDDERGDMKYMTPAEKANNDRLVVGVF